MINYLFLGVWLDFRIVWVSFSVKDSRLGIYYISVSSNSNLWHNFLWIAFHTQSCLVLYSFCTSLLLSLNMRLTVTTLSLHNLYLLFSFLLFIFVGIHLVPKVLFCAHYYYYYYYYWPNGKIIHQWPGRPGSILCRVIPTTQKMVLDASLLKTHHYKVRIKGKVDQSREISRTLPYTSV